MQLVKFNELEKKALLTQKEPLFLEYKGKIVGYYYPIINHQEVKKTKEELDVIMEKVLAQTELTEEEYVSTFMETTEK